MSYDRVLELEEGRRDALVGYYLGQVVPTHAVEAARTIVSTEDLYEFLLIDNQVNAQVDTSEVALAIASLQQYIHMIYNGMEPGHLGIHRKDEHKLWRQSMSEYAVWAGNQMLQDYPENYLDPALRLGRTAAFDEFINETNQGRVSKDSVHAALKNYLRKFESLCNIDTVAGYIDGLDFRNADYYFLGQQRESGAYMWRKLAVSEANIVPDPDAPPVPGKPGGAHVNPAAWTEWEQVTLPKSGQIVRIRPLVVGGRLYVAWVEYRQESSEPDSNGLTTPKHVYSVHLSYRRNVGDWSVPATFAMNKPRGDLSATKEFPFVAVAGVAVPHEPKIILDFSYGSAEESEPLVISLAHEELFRTNPSDLTKAMATAVYTMPGRSGTVQYASNALNRRVSVSREPPKDGDEDPAFPYNPFIDLQAIPGLDASGNECDWVYSLITVVHADADGVTPPVPLRTVRNATGLAPDERNLDAALTGWTSVIEAFSFNNDTYEYIAGSMTPRCRNRYKPTYVDVLPSDIPQIVSVASGVESLYMPNSFIPDGPLVAYIRLNTTFGRELVARAETSIDALLSWNTQHMLEPALPYGDPELMDVHGPYGRYFWELFFHIPHAIAWRLHQEFDYLGAQEWLHYIFNPMARIEPTQPVSPPYWSVRALMEPSPIGYEFEGLVDPDAICHSNPEHYRKAIFMLYVRNLMAYGDQLYRGLTRDTLNEAKLTYVQAMSLMGPKPEQRMIDRWTPRTLAEAAAYNEATFATFESDFPIDQVFDKTAVNGLPWLALLDAPWARLPINNELLTLWDDLQLRMDNLRNNLTLDGKPLLLPLYAPPVNPKDLLQAQNSGSGVVQRGVGSMASVPPYRFRAMLPRVQAAVDTLIRFGDEVRGYYEQKERAMLEDLQQSHVLELSAFAISLQELALEQARESEQALDASQKAIEKRKAYYADLVTEDVSDDEQKAMDLYLASGILGATVGGLQSAAGAMHMASVIVTAFGGGHTRAGAALTAAAGAVAVASDTTRIAGDRIAISEQYRRRRHEWKFQQEQADAELAAIAKQVDAIKASVALAETQVSLSKRAETQAQAIYTFLKTRTSNAGLYQWLLSQMSTLYFQAYDAVVALCLSTESCWRYEMGDDETRFVQPNVWFDNYHGLTAGQALRLQLLRMEAAHLRRNERRLELIRTVSLRQLFDAQHDDDDARDDWQTTLAKLRSSGEIMFELPPWLFDGDYPGHYLRQIATVSVSLPTVIGAYQDIRAILTQVSSKTVLRADIRAMNHLYDQGDDKDATHVRINPRASQSIGISHGMADAGLFMVDFYDERYLPFEGTGALSTWQLTFPRHDSAAQTDILKALNDVIVHVRYTALDGGPTFADAVGKLLDERDSRALDPPN